MKLLNRLERSLYGRFRPNAFIKYLVFIMAGLALLDFFVPSLSLIARLDFRRDLIFSGEVWRVFTFLVLPPSYAPSTTGLIFTALMLFLYYHVGTALENRMGGARFLLYFIIGAVAAIAAGFISGYGTNEFLFTSMYFAFAVLFPNYQLLLYFILPVKVKWLALLAAAYHVYLLITGSWDIRIAILFGLINFILFFGGDFLNQTRNAFQQWKRRRQFKQNTRK